MFWRIDRTFKMTYTKLSDRSVETCEAYRRGRACGSLPLLFMDFSLLSPLEFFADPKNGDGRNNKPPAMRVRVDCYTKKLPFRLQ